MFTYPLIGNYGINGETFQSDEMKAEGVVVREYCKTPSHYKSITTFEEFLGREGKPGISEIDTRMLTIKTRRYGTMKASLAVGEYGEEEVLDAAKTCPEIGQLDLIEEVTCDRPYRIEGKGKRIAVLDLGMKKNILASLKKRGFDIHVFPYRTGMKEIEGCEPDALFLPNGPGDPKRAKNAIKIVKYFLGILPIFGICFGHQIVCLGMGGDTYKLKFGHRGINHPVKDLETGKVYITSQNHGFAVDAESLDRKTRITEINANDGTVEGVKNDYFGVLTVQYHPEAFPGPRDTEETFFDGIKKRLEDA
jgi:carbamoyl-phosphate synthase small subunit